MINLQPVFLYLAEKINMISIIIPTLNEAPNLQKLIPALRQNTQTPIEIIVVDGGSTDQSLQICEQHGVKALTGKRGRAVQMNFGASHAKGEILYFVHADAIPPKGYGEAILTAIQEGYPIGCFRLKFDSKHPLLKINAFFTRFDKSWTRGGDQTLFVTTSIFEQYQGYDESCVIMEEYDFMDRVRSKYPFKIIPQNVLISARKYEKNGYFKVQIANLTAMRMYQKGASKKDIAKTYKSLLK
ncbi:MAG TPA: glycosyltransferase [Saprospiraceae bacterium]|nr:glycosyltransferase [Saprospiraceae bacterium]